MRVNHNIIPDYASNENISMDLWLLVSVAKYFERQMTNCMHNIISELGKIPYKEKTIFGTYTKICKDFCHGTVV